MGAMTGSISHEIRQPLAAMVVSANAGLRWLSKSPPDLDEVIKFGAAMKKRPRAKAKLGRHKVRVTSHRRGSAASSEKTIAIVVRERDELLEQQSATADLLGIISRSKFELRPVLQTVVDTAVRLCRATSGEIFRLDNGVYRFAVGCNLDQEYIERQKPMAPSAGTMVGRTAMTRRVARIDDLLSDPSYLLKEDAKVSGARSMIGVPLMREGEPIGVIILARHRVEPFSEREIKLVTAFADQAVIAIGVRERERQVASQARSAEQALDLLASVSTVANTADDLNALAHDCLVQSAKSARCQFGQLWYRQPGADAVKCFADSYFGHPRFAEFHLSSVKLGLQNEEKSIPGWVWRRRTPIWIEDLAKYLDSLGVEAARAAGFKSALAVPVTIGNDVFAIFENVFNRCSAGGSDGDGCRRETREATRRHFGAPALGTSAARGTCRTCACLTAFGNGRHDGLNQPRDTTAVGGDGRQRQCRSEVALKIAT